MSEDTTTTDAPVSDGGDAPVDSATSQPESTESAEAVKEESTDSSNTNVSDADDIAKWASSKGLELDANNPNEVKLAQMQREAEKKMHESTAQASELKNVINDEVSRLGVPDDVTQRLEQELQVLKANQAVNDFYNSNPDARKYDAEMAQLVTENPNLAAGGIEALYALAKVRDLENGGEKELKDEGKKEGLQDLALKQKVAAATASATTKQTGTGEVTREDVRNALANHDVDWLRKNAKAIDNLTR